MPSAFYDEEVIRVGKDSLTLAVDFRAIDIIEHSCGENGEITPMTDVVPLFFADSPQRSVLGKVLWALLRRHHEGMSLDLASGLMFTEHGGRIALAMRGLIVRVMNFAEVKDENPMLRRGAFAIS